MSSPEANWFPWLARELRSNGAEVVVPQFSTPEGQTLENWRRELTQNVGPLGSDAILIGHSAGASFVLRVLETVKEPIEAAFLVAGFARPLGIPELEPLLSSFVTDPFDWTRIRSNCRKFFVYNSDNDEYVALAQGQEIARALNVSLRIMRSAGHINAASGFTKFPQLLTDLKPLLVPTT